MQDGGAFDIRYHFLSFGTSLLLASSSGPTTTKLQEVKALSLSENNNLYFD
jgi:hypothetical protein